MMSLLYLALAALHFQPSLQASIIKPSSNTPPYGTTYPTRILGGVSVIDTPIVRAADAFARQHASDITYKHVVRSWLYSTLIVEHNEFLQGKVDLEVLAVATLLHDLGWDQTPGSPFVTLDRRFEVDGAIAAREFIRNSTDSQNWDDRRVQLLWDSIALHTIPALFSYKENEVNTTGSGIFVDFQGPSLGISKDEYKAVLAEFPNFDMAAGFNDTVIWLCRTKPTTTYESPLQPWGDKYVANYSSKGYRLFDQVANGGFPSE